MFVLSSPVGTRVEKAQRGGGWEASGHSSRLSSAREGFLRTSKPNLMQPKQLWKTQLLLVLKCHRHLYEIGIFFDPRNSAESSIANFIRGIIFH